MMIPQHLVIMGWSTLGQHSAPAISSKAPQGHGEPCRLHRDCCRHTVTPARLCALQAFPEENAAVQLQLVTAAVKLFLKSPQPRAQQMIQLVLTYATQVRGGAAPPV